MRHFPLTHVLSRHFTGVTLYTPCCACGWVGKAADSMTAAAIAYQRHEDLHSNQTAGLVSSGVNHSR
jgi:hypothetical protein